MCYTLLVSQDGNEFPQMKNTTQENSTTIIILRAVTYTYTLISNILLTRKFEEYIPNRNALCVVPYMTQSNGPQKIGTISSICLLINTECALFATLFCTLHKHDILSHVSHSIVCRVQRPSALLQ